MRPSTLSSLMIVVIGVGLFYWTTLPPDEIALDRSCRAAGARGAISSFLHNEDFWAAQVDALWSERARLLAASTDSNGDTDNNEVRGNERRMSHLSQPPAAQRQIQNRQDQMDRLDDVAWIDGCLAVLLHQGKPYR